MRFIESFNGQLRAECLNTHGFLVLNDARSTLEDWCRDYSEERPHRSMGNKRRISLITRRRSKIRYIIKSGEPSSRVAKQRKASLYSRNHLRNRNIATQLDAITKTRQMSYDC